MLLCRSSAVGGFIGAGVIDRLCADRQPSLKICIFEDLADLAKLRVVTGAMAMHEAMFTMRVVRFRGVVVSLVTPLVQQSARMARLGVWLSA